MKNLTITCKILILLFTLGLVLAARPSVTQAETRQVIRFAFQDRAGSVLPILSVEKGFFKEEGLEVVPLRFSSGPACSEALYSGAADIGAMGDTTAIIMTARSDQFFIVASHATGEERHRIVVRQDSQLRTLHDLKGKRLAVKCGTSTYGGVLAALKKANMSPTDLTIINLTPPTMTEALFAGSVDAFAASEPTPSAAEEKGARELCTLGGLGNEYPILILTNREMADNRPTSLKAFLRAMKKAEQYAAQHPRETVRIMAQATGLSLKTIQRAMKRHQYQLRLDASILASLKKTADFLKDEQIITTSPDLAAATRFEFLASERNPAPDGH